MTMLITDLAVFVLEAFFFIQENVVKENHAK